MTAQGKFNGDGSRLFLLLILYTIQGMAMGFLMVSMPVMLKKYFDYTQLGIVALCPMAYYFKFMFAPIVDTHYFDSVGRRRSWIIPTQLLAGVLMYILGLYFHAILAMENSVVNITFIFAMVFFCLALQDIAVDAWSVTIVKEENLSYSSTVQSIGLNLGIFFASTVYFALNSLTLCNTYIRPIYASQESINSVDKLNPYQHPILDEVAFMKWWGLITIVVSAYTLLLHSEKDDRVKSTNEEVTTLKDMFEALKGLMMNKNLIYLLIFWCGFKLFN
jgi:PAT family acetyl-CoA transporter-like MFS transporter 1